MKQSSVVEVKQVSPYATSMLCIGFFHKRSKGESAQHGGGKTSELLCNKHAMYRVLSQEVKKVNQLSMVEVKQVSCYATSMLCIGFFHKRSKAVKHGGGKTSELLCNKHAMYRVLSQEVKR